MRVLIAPDKFKGGLSAEDAATAIAAGVRDVRPDAAIDLCPMADGGEGTGWILAARGGFEAHTAEVLDPLGRAREARWWRRPADRAAIIELAAASGFALLTAAERDPLRTTTFGTGQLLRTALDRGFTALTLCVGGSATVDGGAGCLQALGCEFRGPGGDAISVPLTGAALADVRSVQFAPRGRFGLRILCDVANPLLGPTGAAAVFGPQKGASPEGVARLEANLAHWADVLQAATGRDVRQMPHGGASGGVPAGLHAAFNAALVPGALTVASDVQLLDRLEGCDLCLTGEGRLDEQTLSGKVVAAVARLAGVQRVPTIALVGAASAPPGRPVAEIADALGLRSVRVITPAGTTLDAALRETAANLRRAAAEALVEFAAGPR